MFVLIKSEQIKRNHASESIEVGERVKIKSLNKSTMEPEDYFYLKKFENKIGTIAEIDRNHSGVYSYRVDFNQGGFGYFYEEDLECLST
jgi:hypothetical protein